ncbi:TIGR02117 family protein [Mucilaginibacter mali]|uniref:TIGR02117 family protein n=1 Tax=Mucilaginibacter mali TaxID=2740462 RepID=A0A7D4U0L0_9SPHI|nr:TIGR02117 family protein [Mucilaginibacter mali]
MVKKILKTIVWTIGSLLAFIILYLCSTYILSHISTNKEDNVTADVPIYILTNGVHTDIVVPVKYGQTNWSHEIKFSNTISKDTTATLIAFGWGDKGFYLNTPTWAQLKFSVAFKAATGLSTSAIHATFYKSLTEGPDCHRIWISNSQYARLCSYIQSSFKTDPAGHTINIPTTANYNNNDAFYDAKRRYNLFYTCNTWANNALKAAGQKACIWTPFDKGIFYMYKDQPAK